MNCTYKMATQTKFLRVVNVIADDKAMDTLLHYALIDIVIARYKSLKKHPKKIHFVRYTSSDDVYTSEAFLKKCDMENENPCYKRFYELGILKETETLISIHFAFGKENVLFAAVDTFMT